MEILKRESLNFLMCPHEWPNWPVCPVKQYKGHEMLTAVVYDFGGELVLWKDANIFMPPSTWKDGVHTNAEEIVDMGWLVD